MGKAERHAKIEQLETILNAKVICFITSDRIGVEQPANFISRDCIKIVEQHLDISDNYDTLALYVVSHGGDIDVPWPLVNLLRCHSKKLQAIIPYICHSAATQIALGCDEIIAGPRAQLSPTDPMLPVRTGTDENAPIMQFGVEDINAFIRFVRTNLGSKFSSHGHEALGKLMERIKPELLGSVNRTYFRSRLLIEKMCGLTSKNYAKKEMDSLIDYLTVAYFSHSHFISRNEMIKDLKLPIVLAENVKIDKVIWELYEEYAGEMDSRKPYDAQHELSQAATNPVTLKIKGKFVESTKRTDVYTQTTILQGGGAPNFNFTLPTLPQNTQIPPQLVQQIINHFLQELNSQLTPFQVAKKVASFGEWKTE
jgi:hypothetical protein